MRACNHYRKSGTTSFREGVIEAECWGCGQKFFLPIDSKPPNWFIERLKGLLSAVKIFESVNLPDGTSRMKLIESDCCKYK